MTEPDIVAELDAWLSHYAYDPPEWCAAAQRARDEIVVLRGDRTVLAAATRRHVADARAEALEEAARLCIGAAEHGFPEHESTRLRLARAIRALMDKPHE